MNLPQVAMQVVAAMYGGDVEGLELLLAELSDEELREFVQHFLLETARTFRDGPDVMGGIVAEMARHPDQVVSMVRADLLEAREREA